jgi:hypothetical protein
MLFELNTHKKATFSDLYLIHQQGTRGAEEHVNHPDRIAWKSMCATDEGREKGEKWCKRAKGKYPSRNKAHLEVRREFNFRCLREDVARSG